MDTDGPGLAGAQGRQGPSKICVDPSLLFLFRISSYLTYLSPCGYHSQPIPLAGLHQSKVLIHIQVHFKQKLDLPYIKQVFGKEEMYQSVLLPALTLLSLVAAQTTTSVVQSTASAAAGTTSICADQPVLEACLASTEAIAEGCASTDYGCLCQKWSAVLVYFPLSFPLFLPSPSIQ